MPINLKLRFITAMIGIPLTLVLIHLGGWALFGLALLTGVVATLEFTALIRGRYPHSFVHFGVPLIIIFLLLAQVGAHWSWFVVLLAVIIFMILLLTLVRGDYDRIQGSLHALITVGGVIYVGLPLVAMLRLRMAGSNGAFWLFLVLVLTWVTDSMSYFVGRKMGKRLLAPRISPKKTIEGALGGWVVGLIVGVVILEIGNLLSLTLLPLLGLVPLAAILGDLWESSLKRYFQSKDSRLVAFNLFPGHGGVLDRIDSLLFVAPTVVLYLAATTSVFQPGL